MNEQPVVIACIDAHPKSLSLLRAASNKARELGVAWAAIYVETPDHHILSRDARERILRFTAMAEQLGGNFIKQESSDPVSGISFIIQQFMETQSPVLHVFIGQTIREGFFNELRHSTAEKIARELEKYPLTVSFIPLSAASYTPSWFDRLQLQEIRPQDLLFALLSVAIAYGASELLRASVPHIEWRINAHNVTAFFLIASAITSLRCGLIPGLISAVLGFSLVNYAFIFPVGKFGIESTADGVSLSIFLVSSVAISLMGAYSRASNRALHQKEKRSEALHSLHRIASNTDTIDDALEVLHEELTHLLNMEVAFFMPKAAGSDKVELVYPRSTALDDRDQRALERCWDDVRRTGLGTVTFFKSDWRFEPLMTANGEIGVLGFKISSLIKLDSSFSRLLGALADQTAAILERIELTRLMSESHVREEREKLRAMLLSSVSHDLKTPLASIIGSLSIYKRMQNSGRLKQEIADELTDTALEEAQRLNSFISNILDMTRIESGDIQFNKDWVPIDEMLGQMPRRLRHHLTTSKLDIKDIPSEIEVQADQMMTEQMLQNVIENALKYSPAGSTVTIRCETEETELLIKIQDQGPGFPDEKLEAIFDKYERLKMSDSKVAGTGLGLAICKAVMEKQSGSILAINCPEGGAEFQLRFSKYRILNSERSKLI